MRKKRIFGGAKMYPAFIPRLLGDWPDKDSDESALPTTAKEKT